MTVTITSPEDIVNAALSRIGSMQRVGSLFEGSEPAKIALDIYGQTRDDLLRGGDWDFASSMVTLTLLKSAPAGGYAVTAWNGITHPPLPWKYEYAYPSNALKIRSLRKTPAFLPDFDPQPVVFSTVDDNFYTAVVKVCVTNLSGPVQASITLQVTDPANWDVSFVEAMIAALARRLAPALANLQTEQAEAQDEQASVAKAEVTQG